MPPSPRVLLPRVLTGAPFYRTPAGVSFLPYDCGTYRQMPYEKVDAATYEALKGRMPPALDWARLRELERDPGEREGEGEGAGGACAGGNHRAAKVIVSDCGGTVGIALELLTCL